MKKTYHHGFPSYNLLILPCAPFSPPLTFGAASRFGHGSARGDPDVWIGRMKINGNQWDWTKLSPSKFTFTFCLCALKLPNSSHIMHALTKTTNTAANCIQMLVSARKVSIQLILWVGRFFPIVFPHISKKFLLFSLSHSTLRLASPQRFAGNNLALSSTQRVMHLDSAKHWHQSLSGTEVLGPALTHCRGNLPK